MFIFSLSALAKDEVASEEIKYSETLSANASFPKKDDVGISFGIPTGGNPTIGASYWLENNRVIRLDFGLDINKPATSGSSTLFGFSIDAGYRFYMKRFHMLMPFFQPGIFFAKAAKVGFGQNMTLAPNIGAGAEYFFSPAFSVSVGTGVSLSFKESMKNIRFATGTTAVNGNFYWNL